MFYFIVLRPKYLFNPDQIRTIVRPIKRATHPNAVAVELHITNLLNEPDPHLHIVVKTDNIHELTNRITHFLKHWDISHLSQCYSPKGAMLYAANKPWADPVFYRGNLVEPC